MPDKSPEQEAESFSAKEHWAQGMTDHILSDRPNLDRNLTLGGVRWACLWIDDFVLLSQEHPPESPEEQIRVIQDSFSSSLQKFEQRHEGYPNGIPSLTSIAIAREVFCFVFGEDAPTMRGALARIELNLSPEPSPDDT